MNLSDRDIRRELELGALRINPAPESTQMQPVSVDLRLGEGVRRFRAHRQQVTLPEIPDNLTEPASYPPEGLTLHPGEFVLATTAEQVTLPDNIVGRLEGKSTLGRLGLTVHSTAGLIDPGFDGCITLEVSNVGPLVLVLRPGIMIAQLTLTYTYSPVRRPYGHAGLGSHYQHQSAATEPRSTRGVPA